MIGAAITGIGVSKLGRNLLRPPMDQLFDATLEAMADAGLTRDNIEDIYPGLSTGSPGMSPLGVGDLRNALGLRTRWHSATPEGAAQMSAIMVAAMAVMTGQARHVICFRVITKSSSQTPERRASLPAGSTGRVGGWTGWYLPMYAMSATTWAAWAARRYFHEFGMTREHLGAISVSQRANAQGNPRVLMYGKPLTTGLYYAARMISTPLGLFDCDVPIDGACVIIISDADAARDCRKAPLRVNAMSAAMNAKETWDQQPDLTKMASRDAADMWENTDLISADVDVLQTYDGFSIFVPLWMQVSVFCGHGEAKDFIAAGHSRIDGKLPTNTGGGQLSAGRLHGFGHLHEACVQLWGEGGARQGPDARVAAIGMGGGPLAGAMLVVRD